MTKYVFARLGVLSLCVGVLCQISLEVEAPPSIRKITREAVEAVKAKASVVPPSPVHEDVKEPSSVKTDSAEPNPVATATHVNLPSSGHTNYTSPKDENATSPDLISEPGQTVTEINSKEKGNTSLQEATKRFLYAPGAALRGLYVFAGLSSLVMLYIAIKLIRLRRKRTRIRKYGLLANMDEVEMTPLGADEDDEDTTLFDANLHVGR